MRLVKAFQFVDEHGEVCPAGWQPGKKTMIPDAKKNQYKEVISEAIWSFIIFRFMFLYFCSIWDDFNWKKIILISDLIS